MWAEASDYKGQNIGPAVVTMVSVFQADYTYFPLLSSKFQLDCAVFVENPILIDIYPVYYTIKLLVKKGFYHYLRDRWEC